MSTGASSSAAKRPLSSTRLPMPSTCVEKDWFCEQAGGLQGVQQLAARVP